MVAHYNRNLVIARVLLIGAAIVIALLPLDPIVIERWYSTGVYARVQRVLTPLSNLVPFAWLNGAYGPAHNAGFEEAAWRNGALRAAFSAVQRQLADGPPAVPGRLKPT